MRSYVRLVCLLIVVCGGCAGSEFLREVVEVDPAAVPKRVEQAGHSLSRAPAVVRVEAAPDLSRNPANLSSGIFCQVRGTRAHSILHECKAELDPRAPFLIPSKSFFVLTQKGTYLENAFEQGELLSQEIEEGAIGDMISKLDVKTQHEGSEKSKEFAARILECLAKDLEEGTNPEFVNGARQLAYGYMAGAVSRGLAPKYLERDFVRASLGIEIGNLLYGLTYRMKTHKVASIVSLLERCNLDLLKDSSQEALEELYENEVEKSDGKHRFACTGIVVPKKHSSANSLIHARSLDQSAQLEKWNHAPVLYLIHEQGQTVKGRPYFKFASSASAGMTFGGGISGFNERGISVSLHQMNTNRIGAKARKGRGEVGPYLQQRVLRETESIDEALELVRSVDRYSAWTIFISDAKTGESASIEFSPKKVQVARRVRDLSRAQSNHFYHPLMSQENFHNRYGDRLETLSRNDLTEEFLSPLNAGKKKGASFKDVLSWISSHEDFYERFPGSSKAASGYPRMRRSYGRAPVKASNIMTTVVLPDRGEFWMSLGDVRPASSGHFVGFRFDFESMKSTPLGVQRTDRYLAEPGYERSLVSYVDAFLAHRAKDNPTKLRHLERAIQEAQGDGVTDVSYLYAYARNLYFSENYREAETVFRRLQQWEKFLHPYTRILIQMYRAINRDALVASLSPEVALDLRAGGREIFDSHLDITYLRDRNAAFEQPLKGLDSLIKSVKDPTSLYDLRAKKSKLLKIFEEKPSREESQQHDLSQIRNRKIQPFEFTLND